MDYQNYENKQFQKYYHEHQYYTKSKNKSKYTNPKDNTNTLTKYIWQSDNSEIKENMEYIQNLTSVLKDDLGSEPDYGKIDAIFKDGNKNIYQFIQDDSIIANYLNLFHVFNKKIDIDVLRKSSMETYNLVKVGKLSLSIIYSNSTVINGYQIYGYNDFNLNKREFSLYLMSCIDLNYINHIINHYNKILSWCMSHIGCIKFKLASCNSENSVERGHNGNIKEYDCLNMEVELTKKYYRLYQDKYQKIALIQADLSYTISSLLNSFNLTRDQDLLVKKKLLYEKYLFTQFCDHLKEKFSYEQNYEILDPNTEMEDKEFYFISDELGKNVLYPSKIINLTGNIDIGIGTTMTSNYTNRLNYNGLDPSNPINTMRLIVPSNDTIFTRKKVIKKTYRKI